MCGICGYFSWEGRPGPDVLGSMVEAMKHRGPDGKNSYVDQRAGLGHTRLSIIDLSDAGTQPMTNEDGSVLCLFNGELYNFRELKGELVEKGHVFRSSCDAEVIPHLYEEEDVGLFVRLRGMFAIAVYDSRRRQLLLARDRFGVKPLYYAALKDRVVFGSEIKAILADPAVPRRLNFQAIHDYLSLLYVPPVTTAFEDIREVAPGEVLIWEGARRSARRFWNIEEERRPFSEIKLDRLGDLLDRAVRSQLMADVPLGAMLSGGVDSSLIVESASRQCRVDGRGMPTFTVGFPDADYDESAAAAEVAQACRVEHHVLRLKEQSADVDLIQRILQHFDQPYADSSAIPFYLIAKEIRSRVKVALSGDGGDEIFGGYERFWRAPAIHRLRRLPAHLRSILSSVFAASSGLAPDLSRQLIKAIKFSGLDAPRLNFALSAYLDEGQKAALYDPAKFDPGGLEPTWRLFSGGRGAGRDADEDVFSACITDNLLNISLPGDMLRKADMMSMLAGLEVRVPLLDEELAAAALSLPHRYKVQRLTCKWLMRQLAFKRLPPRVAKRPKWGFGIPLDKWASPKFREFIKDTLLSPGARINEFMNGGVVSSWVAAFNDEAYLRASISRGGLYQRVYMLLSLELWLRQHRAS